jgi:hypothetical protein
MADRMVWPKVSMLLSKADFNANRKTVPYLVSVCAGLLRPSL